MWKDEEREFAISRHVCVYTASLPRCYTIPRITAEGGDPIGAHTHTQIYTDLQPPPPPDVKRGGEADSGTEV